MTKNNSKSKLRPKYKSAIIFPSIIAIIFIGIIAFPMLPEQVKALSWQTNAANNTDFSQAAAALGSLNSTGNNSSNTQNEIVNKSSVNATFPLDTSSYLMINTTTGEKLLSSDENIRRPQASTLKLLTGLVVIEKLHEEDWVRVGDETLNIEGSQLGLLPGDQILVKDLLTALYVESANDAANVLAVAAFGTMDEFIKAMNNRAANMGLTNSQFKTANGLPASEQYTTASELAQIAIAFIDNDSLMKYVSMPKATIEWTRGNGVKLKKNIANTNQLLNQYPGDIGLKTGTTTEAGQCLVTYVTRSDGNILLVLLGSNQRYQDSIELLDKGIAQVRTRTALKSLINQPDSLMNSPFFFAP